MPNVPAPSARQMERFWQLASDKRISQAQFEKFLDTAEFGPELPSVDVDEAETRLAFRKRLADAGTAYLDVLFPPTKGHGKDWVRLRNGLSGYWDYRDSRVSDERIYIRTIQDLVSMPEVQALKIKNIGAKCVQSLKMRLAEAGLKLGMRPAQITEAFVLETPVRSAPPSAAAAS